MTEASHGPGATSWGTSNPAANGFQQSLAEWGTGHVAEEGSQHWPEGLGDQEWGAFQGSSLWAQNWP